MMLRFDRCFYLRKVTSMCLLTFYLSAVFTHFSGLISLFEVLVRILGKCPPVATVAAAVFGAEVFVVAITSIYCFFSS